MKREKNHQNLHTTQIAFEWFFSIFFYKNSVTILKQLLWWNKRLREEMVGKPVNFIFKSKHKTLTLHHACQRSPSSLTLKTEKKSLKTKRSHSKKPAFFPLLLHFYFLLSHEQKKNKTESENGKKSIGVSEGRRGVDRLVWCVAGWHCALAENLLELVFFVGGYG